MNFLKSFSNYNNKTVAAICMIMASTLGVFMVSIIKYVQTDLNVYTISFFRFFRIICYITISSQNQLQILKN